MRGVVLKKFVLKMGVNLDLPDCLKHSLSLKSAACANDRRTTDVGFSPEVSCSALNSFGTLFGDEFDDRYTLCLP